MSFARRKMFIITGAEGSGKTRVINDLAKIASFYLLNYITTGPVKELGVIPVSWEEYNKFAENDGFVISYKKRSAMFGVTYEEMKRAEESGKPIVWEVDIQWVETVKNQYPEAMIILVNGLGFEGFYKHYKSKGYAVQNFMANQAKQAENLHSIWRSEMDHVVENRFGESQKAAEEIRDIIEGKHFHKGAQTQSELDKLREQNRAILENKV